MFCHHLSRGVDEEVVFGCLLIMASLSLLHRLLDLFALLVESFSRLELLWPVNAVDVLKMELQFQYAIKISGAS